MFEFVLTILLVTILSSAFFRVKFVPSDFTMAVNFDRAVMVFNYVERLSRTGECGVKVDLEDSEIYFHHSVPCDSKNYTLKIKDPGQQTAQNQYLSVAVPEAQKNQPQNFPFYYNQQGQVLDKNHQQISKIRLDFYQVPIFIDGVTGFAYGSYN